MLPSSRINLPFYGERSAEEIVLRDIAGVPNDLEKVTKLPTA
jgi:hypothetical protein